MLVATNPGEVQWMTAGSEVIHNEGMKRSPRLEALQIQLREAYRLPFRQGLHEGMSPTVRKTKHAEELTRGVKPWTTEPPK